MQSFTLIALVTCLSSSLAFMVNTGLQRAMMVQQAPQGVRRGGMSMEYIPDGISPKQWEEMKKKEKAKKDGIDLGYTGITKFKSKSFKDWQLSGQKANYPGEDKKSQPYMRQGGGIDWEEVKRKKEEDRLAKLKGAAKRKEEAKMAKNAPKEDKPKKKGLFGMW